jgi:hypothetical protein
MATNPNQPNQPVNPPLLSFTYAVPIAYTPEDDETYIYRTIIKCLPCQPIPQNDLSSLWNCTRCGNDDNYCTPVEDGDIIYLQLLVNNPDVTLYTIFVYDAAGNIVESGAATNIYNVQDELDGNNYLNINIDASLIDSDCFYFSVYSFECPLSFFSGVSECVAVRMETFGESYSQASHTCLLAACDVYNVYFTDMYCKQPCGDTILIEGQYPKYDCDSNFYGVPYNQSAATQHKLKFRIPATIELVEYSFTNTIVNNKKTRSTQGENWLFRTQKIPPYVVQQIAKAFNSKTLLIDGVEYIPSNKLTKNFEEGRMWIVQETLTTQCDEINFTCN